MKDSLFHNLLTSIQEARELGLIFDEIFCEKCERYLPNKKFLTKNGCKWCDPKGER